MYWTLVIETNYASTLSQLTQESLVFIFGGIMSNLPFGGQMGGEIIDLFETNKVMVLFQEKYNCV